MKIINLPTFAEYASSESGCNVRYTNNFRGGSGLYKQRLEYIYYAHCKALDVYSEAYLRNGMYTNIEDTTVEVNRHMTNDMKKVQRKRRR